MLKIILLTVLLSAGSYANQCLDIWVNLTKEHVSLSKFLEKTQVSTKPTYYIGVLAELKDGSKVFAIGHDTITEHNQLVNQLGRDYAGQGVKILWGGELKAGMSNGAPVILEANETSRFMLKNYPGLNSVETIEKFLSEIQPQKIIAKKFDKKKMHLNPEANRLEGKFEGGLRHEINNIQAILQGGIDTIAQDFEVRRLLNDLVDKAVDKKSIINLPKTLSQIRNNYNCNEGIKTQIGRILYSGHWEVVAKNLKAERDKINASITTRMANILTFEKADHNEAFDIYLNRLKQMGLIDIKEFNSVKKMEPSEVGYNNWVQAYTKMMDKVKQMKNVYVTP